MKPLKWILIITFILLVASIIITYFAFQFFHDKKIAQIASVPDDLTNFNADIRDYGIIPVNITIEKGEQITWKNLGEKNHSLIFKDLNTTSKILEKNENFTIVFNKTGVYEYNCISNPELKGAVIVEE